MPAKTTISGKRYFYIFLAIALLSLFPGLGSAPLFDEDEGYFAEISREMLVSGNYLTPMMEGVPEYDKPVLTYWAQALSMKFLGINEFAVRFPSALATLIWAIAVFLFVARHLDVERAFLSGLIMVCSIQMLIVGKAAISDPLLNLFLALSMFAAFDYFSTTSDRKLYRIFIFIGLGFMTKGPVALIIPVGVTFFYCLARRQLKDWFKAVFNPIGILIFLAITLPWYVLEYLDQGWAFIEDFFFKHNIERFQQPMEGHAGSLLYYVPVIFIGFLPYSGLIFPLFSRLRTCWRTPLLQFSCLWFIFVFLLFSFAGTKLPHYIVYGYTPIFFLIAHGFPHIRKPVRMLWPGFGFLALIVILPSLIPFILPAVDDAYAVYLLQASKKYFTTQYYLWGLSILTLTLVVIIRARSKSFRAMVALGLSAVFIINVLLMPRAGALLQSPVKEAAQIVKERQYPVVTWGYYIPSFRFYLGRFVTGRKPIPGDVVITKRNKAESLENIEILWEKNGMVLARMKE